MHCHAERVKRNLCALNCTVSGLTVYIEVGSHDTIFVFHSNDWIVIYVYAVDHNAKKVRSKKAAQSNNPA